MPYIKPEDRRALNGPIAELRSMLSVRPRGDLNYTITRLVTPIRPTYADAEAALGVLEAVKLELYRRFIAPYEDKKRDENGDVY
jgi:uncharacterized protein DUF6899